MGSASKSETPKKAYAKPVLKKYGSVKLTTRGSGTVNGDAGQGMMIDQMM